MTLNCLRPAAERHRVNETFNWSIGMRQVEAPGLEGPFQPATSSSHVGGYWISEGGFFYYRGGYRRHSRNLEILAAVPDPDDNRLGFVASLDPGGESLPPQRASLRTATNYVSVLRWTAPRDGTFTVSGLFHILDPNYGSLLTPVGIRHGTNELVNFVPDGSSQFPFNFPVTVRQGDTVDFRSQPVSVPAGFSFSPQYIGVQAEISVPNTPPRVEVRAVGDLVWTNGVAYLNLAAMVSDAESAVAEVQIFVDGLLISTLTAPPYTQLVPLSPGNHTVIARATDQHGLVTRSSQIHLEIPASAPELVVVPAEQVRRALYVAATAASFEDLGDTKYAHGLRLLHVAATRIAEEGWADQDPEGFRGYLDDSIERLQARHGQGMARAASNDGVFGTNLSQQEGEDLLWSAAERNPWPLFRIAADRLRNEIGAWIDTAADKRDLAMLQRSGIIWDQSPPVRQALDATLGQQINLSTASTAKDLANRLGAVESGQGAVLRDLTSLIQENGEIRTDINTLKQTFQTSINQVQVGIDAQLKASEKILQGQAEIYQFLTDQAAQAELEADRERARREYEQTIAGAQSGVYLLSTFIGFADPDAGKKVGVIGNSFITIADSMNKISKLESVFSAGGLIASGNILGAVMNVVSLFGETGPTPEQMILEELGELKQLVYQLGEQMHDRFDRVDMQLAQIYQRFSAEFDQVNFRLGVIQYNIDSLQNLTLELRESIARLELRMQELFQAQEARRFTELLLTLQEYEAGVLTMSSDAFVAQVRSFYQVATSNSLDEIAAPTANRPTTDAHLAQQLVGTNDNLTANLNYLNTVILSRGWMAGRGLLTGTNTQIASASEWMSGSDGMIRLFARWPQFARSDPFFVNARLNPAIATGETLRTALERITLERSGTQWQTNALWGHLVKNYTNKAAQFLTALHNFELEQRVALVAQGDTSRIHDAPYVDFWGVVNQSTLYVPPVFSQPIPPLNNGTTAGGPLLPPPGGWAGRLADVPELAFGELVRATTNRWDYRNVGFVGDRSRRSGFSYGSAELRPVTYKPFDGTIREGRLQADISVAVSHPSGMILDSVRFDWRYIHNKHHVHGFRRGDGVFYRFGTYHSHTYDTGGPPGLSLYWLLTESGFFSNFHIRESQGSDNFGWPNWFHIIDDFWKGRWEPVLPDYRVESRHKISPVRDNFAANASLHQRPPSAAEHEFHALIEARLRSFQAGFVDAATNVNGLRNPGTSLGAAALELSGARELLRVFVELGLPVSYQQSDVLRALFTGSERLPDLQLLLDFCAEARVRPLTDALHTGRPDFAGLLNRRVDALEVVLNEALARIQATGKTEIIPLVSDTLRELYFTREVTQNPLRPYLFVHSVGPNQAGVRVLGERYVTYGLEWSSNMVHWVTQPGTVTDGGSISLDFNAANSGFLRVKSQ